MKFAPELYHLSNGIPVILDPMDMETTYVQVYFNTGARDEKRYEYGISHFCEHLLCKGTPTHPSSKAIVDYLSWHGGWRNAATSMDAIKLYGRILGDNLTVLTDVFADCLQNSLFDPACIEKERAVVLDELRNSTTDVNQKYLSFISKELFDNKAYSIRLLGTKKTINSFTRDQLLDFMARRFSAKNCIIGISGKIPDKDAVLRSLEKGFSFLPQTDVSNNTKVYFIPNVAHYSTDGCGYVLLRILFPRIWYNKPGQVRNWAAFTKFKTYLNEQIRDAVRERNGLVYQFKGVSVGPDERELTGFHTDTSAKNAARVVRIIAQQAADIYNNNPFTDDDMMRLRNKDWLNRAEFLESSKDRCQLLVWHYARYGTLYNFEEVTRALDEVTREDVIRASRGFFVWPAAIVSYGDDFQEDLGAVWNDNFKVKAWH